MGNLCTSETKAPMKKRHSKKTVKKHRQDPTRKESAPSAPAAAHSSPNADVKSDDEPSPLLTNSSSNPLSANPLGSVGPPRSKRDSGGPPLKMSIDPKLINVATSHNKKNSKTAQPNKPGGMSTSGGSGQTANDFENLSFPKLQLIRGWVDTIRKKDLLDPQDVGGYKRQQSEAGNEKDDDIRRFSMSSGIAVAEIHKDTASQTNSMLVQPAEDEDPMELSKQNLLA